MSQSNVQEILPKDTGIIAYNPFYAQLEELKKTNAVTVFEYATPAGNKAARSYVFSLRKTKTAVDNVRKEEKAASLEYGRKVDSEAKNIITEIEAMIEVHQSQIDAIERAEEERVAAIQERIKGLTQNAENIPAGATSETLRHLLATITATDVDTSFAEFMHIAVGVKNASVEYLNAQIVLTEKREADARELERLRVEAAERSRIEREESIRKAAQEAAEAKAERDRVEAEAKAAKALQDAEDARIAAEAKAAADLQAEKDAAIRREAEAKRKAEEALAKAVKDAEDAAAKREDEANRVAKAKMDEDAKRAADVEHKRKIHNEILDKLAVLLNSGADAKLIVQAAIKGEIPHVKIVY